MKLGANTSVIQAKPVSNRDIGLVRNMLGNLSDNELSSFTNRLSDDDYVVLERDSAAKVFNDYNKYKHEELDKLKNEYNANKFSDEDITLADDGYREAYRNISEAEGKRLQGLYRSLEDHSDLYDRMEFMGQIDSNATERYDSVINERRNIWQNKLKQGN